MPCCFYLSYHLRVLNNFINKNTEILYFFSRFREISITNLQNGYKSSEFCTQIFRKKMGFIKILGATLLFYRVEAYYNVVGIWIQFKANYNFSYVCIFAIFTEIFASSIFIKFGVIEQKFSPNFPMERRIWTNLVSKCSE